MIGSILMCDRCGDTGGALPSESGSKARLAARRGTIRRIKLGRTIYNVNGRPGRLYSLDLCKRCNRPDVILEAQITQENRAHRCGDGFKRA
jgi:hypothetical protein